MKRSVLSTTIILLMLTAPAALASWNAFGMHEPNTKLDVSGGWMWKDPDTSTSQLVRKVYFATFLGQYPGTTVNPNVAMLGSATNAPDYAYWAMLGVWKDCNKDGYVGLQEQGVLEYKAEILLDTNACPKQTTPIEPITGKPALNWFPSHNDGQWVRELLPIQWLDMNPDNVQGDTDPWNINDNGARVWYDNGLATDVAGGGGCYINPQPAGTYRSTGGFIKWGDCLTGFRVTDNFDAVADSNPTLKPLSFSDHPRDQDHSTSTLNRANPWGNEADASDVNAWDCSGGPLVTQPVGSGGATGYLWVNVSQPRVPPGVSATGSPSGTANATASGFDQCERNTHNDGVTHVGDSAAHAPYANEGSNNQIWKTETLNMVPLEARRPTAPFSAVLGKGTPANFGTPVGGYMDSGNAGGYGLWYTVPNTLGPAKAGYSTAYASVSADAIRDYGLSMPKGATATLKYGAEACGTSTTGVKNGWQCDPTKWYLDTDEKSTDPTNGYLGKDPDNGAPCNSTDATGCNRYGVRVGHTYNLRAIDCYDQSVTAARQNGVSYQTVWNQAVGVVHMVNPSLSKIAPCEMAP